MNENTSFKKLYRSQNEKMLGGVCGDLAEYFGIDPTWVRLIFIFFAFLAGFALILYVINVDCYAIKTSARQFI